MTPLTTQPPPARRPVSPAPPTIVAAPTKRYHSAETKWTPRGIARNPAGYIAWLQQIPTEHWIAIHAAPGRREQDFDQAIAACRAYKTAHAAYQQAGRPAHLRPGLRCQETRMRQILTRLNFSSPAELWAEYQKRITARDQYGRHPDHTAEIAGRMAYYGSGPAIATQSYQACSDPDAAAVYNNVDAALEVPRYTAHQLPYVGSEDVQAAYLHERLTHQTAQIGALDRRLAEARQTYRATAPAEQVAILIAGRQLRRIHNDAEQRRTATQQQLDQYDSSNERGHMNYGLTRSAPIPTDGRWQVLPLDTERADRQDAIRNLISLHVRNQDQLYELQSIPAAKLTLGETRRLQECRELQTAITTSLAHHNGRQLRIIRAPLPVDPGPVFMTDAEALDLQDALDSIGRRIEYQQALLYQAWCRKQTAQTLVRCQLAPPTVAHCHNRRADGPDYVYVARPSKWGNPYRIGADGDRATVIAKYRRWLAAQPALLAALPELTGKQLGCYCAPQECHADVLVRAWWHYVARQSPPTA